MKTSVVRRESEARHEPTTLTVYGKHRVCVINDAHAAFRQSFANCEMHWWPSTWCKSSFDRVTVRWSRPPIVNTGLVGPLVPRKGCPYVE